MARGPIPDRSPDRPSVPQVQEMVRAYLALPGNDAGGSLHIVLIDNNESDESIESSRERARRLGDEAGVALADALLAITRTQRRRVCRHR